MESGRKQVTSKQARAILDGISRATLDRYRADPRLNFPPAVERRGRLYFYEDELRAWKDLRPRVASLPRRGGKAASHPVDDLQRAA